MALLFWRRNVGELLIAVVQRRARAPPGHGEENQAMTVRRESSCRTITPAWRSWLHTRSFVSPTGRELSFRREAVASVPGHTSRRHSHGLVSQGDHPRPELMAIDELELDALAQTGEQRRPVSGKDRLHKEHVLV